MGHTDRRADRPGDRAANETQVGSGRTKTRKALIFDDSNLFRVDKFSGWDRVEGGGRANYGVQYTAQFNQGGFVNTLFGQSYSLFGDNSFAIGGATNTGLDSGLDTGNVGLRRPALVSSRTRLTRSPPASASTTTPSPYSARSRGARQFRSLESRQLLYGDYAAQP